MTARRTLITTAVLLLAALPATAGAALKPGKWMAIAPASARPPDGNYACFYEYRTVSSPFFMGYLHIDSASKYHYTGAGHGKGTYTYSHKRLRFHGGPLKHEFGIDEGRHGSGSSAYWRITLYTHPGNSGYASTCDGPHAK